MLGSMLDPSIHLFNRIVSLEPKKLYSHVLKWANGFWKNSNNCPRKQSNKNKTNQHLSPQLCPADKCRNMVTQKFVSFWSLGDLLARESELACWFYEGKLLCKAIQLALWAFIYRWLPSWFIVCQIIIIKDGVNCHFNHLVITHCAFMWWQICPLDQNWKLHKIFRFHVHSILVMFEIKD